MSERSGDSTPVSTGYGPIQEVLTYQPNKEKDYEAKMLMRKYELAPQLKDNYIQWKEDLEFHLRPLGLILKDILAWDLTKTVPITQ